MKMNLSVTIPYISTPNLSALGKIKRGKIHACIQSANLEVELLEHQKNKEKR
jgi:hypothetical protein